MSRVSPSLAKERGVENVNKPLTTGATADQLAAAVRDIIEALRAAGVLKDDSSGDAA